MKERRLLLVPVEKFSVSPFMALLQTFNRQRMWGHEEQSPVLTNINWQMSSRFMRSVLTITDELPNPYIPGMYADEDWSLLAPAALLPDNETKELS